MNPHFFTITLGQFFMLKLDMRGVLIGTGRLGLDVGWCRRVAGEPWFWQTTEACAVNGRFGLVAFCLSWMDGRCR
jgi:hypothetical protein